MKSNSHLDIDWSSASGQFDRVDSRLFDEFDYIANDTHSKLNSVLTEGLIVVDSVSTVQRAVRLAIKLDRPISISAGRHAMGGQQFCHKGILLDMSSFNKVLEFNRTRGTITVQAGITWRDLVSELDRLQYDVKRFPRWSIIQKPTGADDLSLGGCLSSNIHGRGLNLKPFVDDIESFELVDAKGNLLFVSRDSNRELFKLAIGGYGLFGVIISVTINLTSSKMMKRKVELVEVKDLASKFQELLKAQHQYGDFQFSIDSKSEKFLRQGILASYKEETDSKELPKTHKVLSLKQWRELLELAHKDKSEAFKLYLEHYLATDGQVYRSDTMQLSTYDDYHSDLDKILGCSKGTEIISELYVPLERLHDFMEEARLLFIDKNANLIYGTIRLIEKDSETFIPWAKEKYACVIFNLHTEHGLNGISKNAIIFRQLIKLARQHNGSFYLTYHRYVDKEDLEQCYPRFKQFLEMKLKYDPYQLFQSQWFRHYKKLFGLST